ncbi:hypothetical protein EMGBS15_10520, partial [Filimonas sp.]
MKIPKLLMFLVSLFTAASIYAQSPQAIPYQAVARDINGSVLANQSIALRITLIDSNVNSIDYQETHLVTTNSLGLFTLNIGEGTSVTGTLAGIYWPISGNEHVQVEMDPSGGMNYVDMGINKLNSVPFALHANTSSDNKWNQNANNIYNNNIGGVGIGTATPNGKLHVSGNGFPMLNVEGSSPIGTWFSLGNTSTGGQWFNEIATGSGNGEGPGKLLFTKGTGPNGTAGTIMAFDHASGNVGIGTNTPSAKLDVNGMGFFRNNPGGFVAGGGTGIKISTENNQGNIFGYDYSSFTPIDLILQGEGANVGIGTHYPESTLHITKPNDATTFTIGGIAKLVNLLHFDYKPQLTKVGIPIFNRS